jgi:hypothetical protein
MQNFHLRPQVLCPGVITVLWQHSPSTAALIGLMHARTIEKPVNTPHQELSA